MLTYRGLQGSTIAVSCALGSRELKRIGYTEGNC